MAIAVEDDAANWLVHVTPAGELTRARDRGIAAALAMTGIGFDDMMTWHRTAAVGPVVWLESMYHSWALLAWSHSLRDHADARPWLVHVAPNDDLGVPAVLGCNAPGSLLAIMEDLTIELGNPRSVGRAIEHGLIGVGSYIVPWLHAQPADVVHLVPDALAPAQNVCRFCIESEAPNEPSRLVMSKRVDGACSYQRTDDPAALACGWTAGQPVLLDIDLAYFALMRNGQRKAPAQPCLISQLVDGLRPLVPWIATVTIAYAPGSCPAERWAPLAAQLREALTDVLGSDFDASETPTS
ncbi:hypothetical protein [Paraburkholderia ultramafica]|nr:hypothetical protein [Paraburkholderia ultramafica]